MNNPIHTHTLELDITCAGHTKTHELRVRYTYTPKTPFRHNRALLRLNMLLGQTYDWQVGYRSAQVEIHSIKEIVYYSDPNTKTKYTMDKEIKMLSPEHIEAIEREILEGLEWNNTL